jgi:curved DNA-binding protein CbpA
MERDFYTILGVLPDAEPVVITAAYRALTSLYHPDKWTGNTEDSHKRMAEINVAYGVLGDAKKRKEYEQLRQKVPVGIDTSYQQTDAAFDSALAGVEDRWAIAVSVYPDLVDIRKMLAKTAHRLAFAFVVVMLENKNFASGYSIAFAMEKAFLQRHFGSNDQVLRFAKELITLGQKDAVLALNRLIDVLGSNAEVSKIIFKVEQDFKIKEVRSRESQFHDASVKESKLKKDIEEFRNFVLSTRSPSAAQKLAVLMGYEIAETKNGLFKFSTFEVRRIGSMELVNSFKSPHELTAWVVNCLC